MCDFFQSLDISLLLLSQQPHGAAVFRNSIFINVSQWLTRYVLLAFTYIRTNMFHLPQMLPVATLLSGWSPRSGCKDGPLNSQLKYTQWLVRLLAVASMRKPRLHTSAASWMNNFMALWFNVNWKQSKRSCSKGTPPWSDLWRCPLLNSVLYRQDWFQWGWIPVAGDDSCVPPTLLWLQRPWGRTISWPTLPPSAHCQECEFQTRHFLWAHIPNVTSFWFGSYSLCYWVIF